MCGKWVKEGLPGSHLIKVLPITCRGVGSAYFYVGDGEALHLRMEHFSYAGFFRISVVIYTRKENRYHDRNERQVFGSGGAIP